MSSANTICRGLKHLRKLRGKTQEEVYNETGISICNYETEHRFPTIYNLQVLCKYFNYDAGSLFKLADASTETGIPIEKLMEDSLS